MSDLTRRQRELFTELRSGGRCDGHVLDVLVTVPRERFVPTEIRSASYDNAPLPIGEGQTISQPLIVAMMASAASLAPDDCVLEVGTGSGYGAAVLAGLARKVVSIERIHVLAERARGVLDELGIDNVSVVEGDGTLGWPGEGPYDAIVVTAAGPEIPAPLLDQLAPGGRLVAPVGGREGQQLVRMVRTEDGFDRQELGGVAFVPLIGEAGWSQGGSPK